MVDDSPMADVSPAHDASPEPEAPIDSLDTGAGEVIIIYSHVQVVLVGTRLESCN